MNKNSQFIVFLMGPTASGKTDLAIKLCQQYPFEIISVDSALIYQQMNIGTAKPTPEELALAPHALIDFLPPQKSYSVANFRDDALEQIAQIHQRNHIPLLVGGTMLYHRALLYGLSELPSADEVVREKLLKKYSSEKPTALHEQLKQCDPISADKIHPNDPQRILRALEVFELTGQPLSLLQEQSKQMALKYPHKKIVIAPKSREELRERIQIRFEQMLAQGFVEEVEQLFQQNDIHADLPSMRCVGYRQVWEYLDKQVSYKQMTENAINATRQFAKRQMTWLRKEQDALWLETNHPKNLELVVNYLKDFFKR
ncbi:MAG: tRNA (adenosine(37)-N6)-dimethylallyltransferase MiaA [Gammaproteobacteria bacterium]|nr:tRNA (adenosine(37)-N6)-dimethylallyltransferase MiaA [Gammaproteobacteria bacterium]